jgi:hypothetical protein
LQNSSAIVGFFVKHYTEYIVIFQACRLTCSNFDVVITCNYNNPLESHHLLIVEAKMHTSNQKENAKSQLFVGPCEMTLIFWLYYKTLVCVFFFLLMRTKTKFVQEVRDTENSPLSPPLPVPQKNFSS